MAGRKKAARACLGLRANLFLSLLFFFSSHSPLARSSPAARIVAYTRQPVSPDRGQDVAYGALTRWLW